MSIDVNAEKCCALPNIEELGHSILNESFGDFHDSKTNHENNKISFQVGPQHFDLLKLIGEGAFGKVFIVKNCLNKSIYAMKVISKKLLRKKNHMLYMKSERQILTKIDHPFVVSLKFAFQTETKLFLVMNFLNGGELFFHLRKRGLLTQAEAKFYAGELILAIEFLHSRDIVHRDLKPENVLLDARGHICVTDFGLAKEIEFATELRTLCGTSEYMAPEMLTRSGYGPAVDWWALGALCYEMMVGQAPFTSKNQKELDRKILSDKVSLPSYLTAASHSLLKGLLDKDPSTRLGCRKGTMFSIGGMSQLKQHEFFLGIDWGELFHMKIPPPIRPEVGGEQGLACFSEEFTNQVVSSSFVEESIAMMSPDTSAPPTPAGSRSRAGSGDMAAMFEDFNYTTSEFQVTQDQMESFEAELLAKVKSVNKKKKLRAKEDAARKAKAAQEMEVREAEERDKRRKQEEDESLLVALREEAERKEKLRMEEEVRLKEFVRLKELKREHDVYLADVENIQKTARKYRKKLREITDIEDGVRQGKSLSGAQEAKLRTKQEIEDNIAQCEDELYELEKRVNPEVRFLEVQHWSEDQPSIAPLHVAPLDVISATTVATPSAVTTQASVDQPSTVISHASVDQPSSQKNQSAIPSAKSNLVLADMSSSCDTARLADRVISTGKDEVQEWEPVTRDKGTKGMSSSPSKAPVEGSIVSEPKSSGAWRSAGKTNASAVPSLAVSGGSGEDPLSSQTPTGGAKSSSLAALETAWRTSATVNKSYSAAAQPGVWRRGTAGIASPSPPCTPVGVGSGDGKVTVDSDSDKANKATLDSGSLGVKDAGSVLASGQASVDHPPAQAQAVLGKDFPTLAGPSSETSGLQKPLGAWGTKKLNLK